MKDRIKQKGIETIILSFVFIVFARSISYSKEYLEVLGESFWGYLMSSSMYIILIGIVLISKKGRLTFAINSSWVVYLFFVSFFSLQSLFVTDAIIVPFHTFLIQSFVFLMALEMSFRHKLLRVTNISRVFFLLVLYEIIICFLQYGYFIDSQGVYFRVYGTMSNPNLSGMFLAISSPMILYGALLERKPFKYAFLIVFFGVIVAILLLKSRTALIGFVVANTYFLFYFMQSFKRRVEIFFSKTKSYFSYIITFTLLIVGLFFLFNLYSYKKESSESRLMIWKLSTELGFEKPLLGHGLFMFEKEYNLMQARYFLTDSATENEKYNSDFIQIAYNDYLQMFVEGGVIGLGLLSLFLLAYYGLIVIFLNLPMRFD